MIESFRDHAANERTFLAWIRTAIAVAGFGILVEKLPSTPTDNSVSPVLVGLSAVLVLMSSLRFVMIRRQINRGETGDRVFGLLEIMFAATLGLLLLAVFAFLLSLVRAG